MVDGIISYEAEIAVRSLLKLYQRVFVQPKENIKLTEPKPVEPNLPPRYLVSGVSINVRTPEKVQCESPQFLGRIHHKGHRRKSLENYSVSRVNALRNNHMSSFNFKDGTQ